MSKNAEKAKELAAKGKEKARALYNKGNELMDKVSFLKNPLHKKIVWGVAGALCVLVVWILLGGLFGSGERSGHPNTSERLVEYPNTPAGICQCFVDALKRHDIDAIFEASMIYVTPTDPIACSQLPSDAKEKFKSEQTLYSRLKVIEYDGELTMDIGGNIGAVVTLEKDGEKHWWPLYARDVNGIWKIDLEAFEERRGYR